MSTIYLTDWDTADLRASPDYALVPYDRLSAGQKRQLGGLADEAGGYGIVMGKGSSPRAIHALDCDTALLFLTLMTPGPLPSFARRALRDEAEGAIARLVADGILEIKRGDRFVSGPDAIAREDRGSDGGGGAVAKLSRAALEHASRLGIEDPRLLSLKLYGYHRAPLSPRLAKAYPTRSSIEAYWGLDAGEARSILDRAWIPLSKGGDEAKAKDVWIAFRSARPRAAIPATGPMYKLYISPAFDAIPQAFAAALPVLTDLGVDQLKVGATIEGLLRPDKWVAYFGTFEELSLAAGALDRALAAIPAHGVPFSGGVDARGLLSWGMDPPPGARGDDRESYRLWMTNKLASAIVDAARAGAEEPWRYAVDRLALEGFDTRSWTPTERIWKV